MKCGFGWVVNYSIIGRFGIVIGKDGGRYEAEANGWFWIDRSSKSGV